jgi:hypothetical protein
VACRAREFSVALGHLHPQAHGSLPLLRWCGSVGYKLKLIMPSNMSQERRDAMAAYGAELLSVPAGAMEMARDLAMEMQANGEGIVLNQFGNFGKLSLLCVLPVLSLPLEQAGQAKEPHGSLQQRRWPHIVLQSAGADDVCVTPSRRQPKGALHGHGAGDLGADGRARDALCE